MLQEIDVKAGGGQLMTIGTMLRQWLVKLEWFSTLFPRIPVPIQQKIQKHLEVSLTKEKNSYLNWNILYTSMLNV